jgi:hypothetical protein
MISLVKRAPRCARYRELFTRFPARTRPARARARSASSVRPSALRFPSCPVCRRAAVRGGRSSIMDHSTKGEAPFANLVKTQLDAQPAARVETRVFPNGGRKVLLFSDGRQKAARLARDIPRHGEWQWGFGTQSPRCLLQGRIMPYTATTGVAMDRTVRELALIAFVALLCLMLSWAFEADLFSIFFAAAAAIAIVKAVRRSFRSGAE